jgi:hypothetical protein
MREKEDSSPVEDREEDEENGNGPKGNKFGKEGGGIQIHKREKEERLLVEDREEDEEHGNRALD